MYFFFSDNKPSVRWILTVSAEFLQWFRNTEIMTNTPRERQKKNPWSDKSKVDCRGMLSLKPEIKIMCPVCRADSPHQWVDVIKSQKWHRWSQMMQIVYKKNTHNLFLKIKLRKKCLLMVSPVHVTQPDIKCKWLLTAQSLFHSFEQTFNLFSEQKWFICSVRAAVCSSTGWMPCVSF